MNKIITYLTDLLLAKGWFNSNVLTKYCLKNYPMKVTTRIDKFKTVYVKKGKIREWRTFDENGNRVDLLGLKDGSSRIIYPNGTAQ